MSYRTKTAILDFRPGKNTSRNFATAQIRREISETPLNLPFWTTFAQALSRIQQGFFMWICISYKKIVCITSANSYGNSHRRQTVFLLKICPKKFAQQTKKLRVVKILYTVCFFPVLDVTVCVFFLNLRKWPLHKWFNWLEFRHVIATIVIAKMIRAYEISHFRMNLYKWHTLLSGTIWLVPWPCHIWRFDCIIICTSSKRFEKDWFV